MRVVFLLLALPLIGCVTSKPMPRDTYAEAREQTERMLNQQREAVDREKQRYANEYAAFRCDPGAMPPVQKLTYDQHRIKSLTLSPLLSLRLRLGKSVEIPGAHTYRTESDFGLFTASGRQLAVGESMMCLWDEAASDGDLEVLFNPAEKSVLIQEETVGAGSSVRHIAFIPKPGADVRDGGKSADWQVMHLDLPQRSHGAGDESDHIGRVFGLSSRKVYVEMDGVHYAFPVEEVVTTELGISNG